eukprot:15457483-Alexandrium_andersonii.AAC.1
MQHVLPHHVRDRLPDSALIRLTAFTSGLLTGRRGSLEPHIRGEAVLNAQLLAAWLVTAVTQMGACPHC